MKPSEISETRFKFHRYYYYFWYGYYFAYNLILRYKNLYNYLVKTVKTKEIQTYEWNYFWDTFLILKPMILVYISDAISHFYISWNSMSAEHYLLLYLHEFLKKKKIIFTVSKNMFLGKVRTQIGLHSFSV